MALRTAPCPRCRNLVVFGERACRYCAQVFEYGEGGPPPPAPHDVWLALYAAGAVTAQQLAAAGVVVDAPAVHLELSSSLLAPIEAAAPSSTATVLEGLDTGRFAPTAMVASEAVPGLIDSTLFASFTPRHVDVEAVPGLEANRFEPITVAVAPSEMIESTALLRERLPDAPTHQVPGLFGSDVFRADVDIAAGADSSADLEVLPSARRRARGSGRSRGNDELARVTCTNCGALHKMPRCPTCGTTHPDASG